MKGEDLFLALGKISDDLIEDAAPKKRAFYKRSVFKWAVAIAVCLCVIVIGVAFSTTIPKLNNVNIDFSGMGYEGTNELSLKASDDINPWNESLGVKSLPVYKNLRYNSGELAQVYFTKDDLKKQGEEICKKLNLTYSSKENEEGNIEGVYGFSLDTDIGTVAVSPTGNSLRITNGDYSLVNKHMELFFWENNKIVSGDYYTYSVDGEVLSKETRSYLKGKNIKEDIVNFNFSSHYLSESDNEIISNISCYLTGSKKYGEYPIKSAKQAREDLLSGEYVSSAFLEDIDGEKITNDVIYKVDLIYYTDGNPELYLPYYRFYVRCCSGSDYEEYAYFYVCAIKDEYVNFENSFNGEYQ